jgi:predicted HTH transcriptional regulator
MNDELVKRFISEPTHKNLTALMDSGLEETDLVEFKESVSSHDKLAKTILSFANTQGGLVVIGVKQDSSNSFELIGVDKYADKQTIFSKVRRFLPSTLNFDVQNTEMNGRKLQVIIIGPLPNLRPFVCSGDGPNIRATAIYVQKGTECLEVDYGTLQELINDRIDSQFSSRREHYGETSILENLSILKLV